MPNNMHRTVINVPQETFQRARIKAVREGTNVSEVIRHLLARWVSGEVRLDTEESSREKLVALARAGRGMWADRDPDAYLTESRAGLETRDEELERARLDA
jgi:plasmid stability protein